MFWLIVAIVPILMSSVMTSLTGTIIDVASSCTVSKSGISIVSSVRGGATRRRDRPSSCAAAPSRAAVPSRGLFSRRPCLRACVRGRRGGRRPTASGRRSRATPAGRPAPGAAGASSDGTDRCRPGGAAGVRRAGGTGATGARRLCRPGRAAPRRGAARRRGGRAARCAGRAKPRRRSSAAAPRGERSTADRRAPGAAAESASARAWLAGAATGAGAGGRGGSLRRGAARRRGRRGCGAGGRGVGARDRVAGAAQGLRARRPWARAFAGARALSRRPGPPRRAPALRRRLGGRLQQHAADQIGDLVRHDAELILCLENAAQALVEERRQLFRGEPDFFGELENPYFSGQVHSRTATRSSPISWSARSPNRRLGSAR